MKDADGSTWCRVPFARTAAGILRGAPAPALDVQLLISFIKLTSNGTQLSNDGLSGVCGPLIGSGLSWIGHGLLPFRDSSGL